MQASVVELIRTLMKVQKISIRRLSSLIAAENGGSDLGFTQQITRILNDPDYDPSFSTVEKILSALGASPFRKLDSDFQLKNLSQQIQQLQETLEQVTERLDKLEGRIEQPVKR
ncbi:XRE family transcriptional regulator [Leptolyngbya sp. FACHB-261]|uniref:XRE family transcriptional regulator n=1 Tax=Leptolyngbya sp. FACHB-261 TaxID=2692806 RepID=UPI001687B7EA|nr:XRE family transcriptional regulator [Leptolyngbya sp. FACHB-261]MBD2100138.1 XRE family transcriptional regulator [Leptolyngbya sp. FACHB-261]